MIQYNIFIHWRVIRPVDYFFKEDKNANYRTVGRINESNN